MIYSGDNRAIIQETNSDTSLGDALQLLAGPENVGDASKPYYSVEKGSIKVGCLFLFSITV